MKYICVTERISGCEVERLLQLIRTLDFSNCVTLKRVAIEFLYLSFTRA